MGKLLTAELVAEFEKQDPENVANGAFILELENKSIMFLQFL